MNIQQGILAGIINASEDIIIVQDLDGCIISWNRAASLAFGYSEDDVLGKSASLIVPEHLRGEENELLERVKQGEKIGQFETFRATKAGKLIHVAIGFSPVTNQLGEIVGLSAIGRDIQRIAEEKQGMLAAIIDSSDDAIVSKNLFGIITSWNRSAERLFEYSAHEIIGRHVHTLIPEKLWEEEAMIISRIKRGEKVEHFKTLRVAKSGKLLQLSVTVSPIKNRAGEIIGASKIARDVSQHRLAEEKQGILAAIVSSSDDAIVSKTLEGIITSWNFGAERLFGYHESEIIGKSIYTIIPRNRHHEEQGIINKIKKGEKVDHFETVRVAKDGRELSLSITVSPVKNRSGEIIGASKIARDISEQVKVREDRELYTKRLEKLNHYKDEFIGMASHELKTPLTSINANLQLLQRKLQESAFKGFVTKTLRHVNKLTALVSELLDVTRIQEGKLQLNKTYFDLAELVEECVESIQPTTTHTIQYESKITGAVLADRQRIEQVIVNLLTNAIKYSPHGKQVIVSTEMDEHEMCVSIQDFGIGIPADQTAQIFSRFYRVEGLAPTYSGLGIGLYISSEIVQRHNGKIWVESEIGKGSTFKLKMPLK